MGQGSPRLSRGGSEPAAVARRRRKGAPSGRTLDSPGVSAGEDGGKPSPGLDRRLGVLPRRATQGFGGQKGQIWVQNRAAKVVRPATHRGKWRQGVAALSTSRPLPGASIPGTSLALTTPLSSLPVPPPLGRHDTGTVSLRPTASLSPGGVVIGNDSNILELVLKPGGR